MLKLLAITGNEIPQSGGNHGFSFETKLEDHFQLQAIFGNYSTVIPVLFMAPTNHKVISPLLRRLILSTIKPDSQISPEEVDKFCSGEPDLTFVVWPLPVVVNNQNLLLIRVKSLNIRSLSAAKREAVEKALVCILSMTAISFIFAKDAEKTDAFELINQASTHLRKITGLTQAQIVSLNYFEDEDWDELIKKFNSAGLNCVIPVSELSSQFEALLHSESINSFLQTRLTAMQSLNCQTFISLLMHVFEMCAKAANADFEYNKFMSLKLTINDPQFAEHAKSLDNIVKEQIRIRGAKAIKFLGESANHFSLNPNLIPTLTQSYDFSKETIVIILIGVQGTGKSTLLNNIIRECIGSSSEQTHFKVGNTVNDTTTGGYILSHPLFLPSGHQLMLVDMEGMASFREEDTRKSITRENLISSLFTIASVPCIIFDNDETKKSIIEGYIQKLCLCAKNFSTTLERIIILLHDKEDNPSGETNIKMQSWIESLNPRYFDRREVIKVMKKPNLSNQHNRDMCNQFLKKLIANIDFPKKDCFMTSLNLGDVLAKLELIARHSTTNLEEIAVTEDDLLIIKRCLEKKSIELKSIYRGIKSDGSMTLVDIFDNGVRYFSVHLDESLSLNQKKYLQIILEAKITHYRGKLRVVDAVYKDISTMRQEELIEFLKQQSSLFAQQSSDKAIFDEQLSQLLTPLRKVAFRYPEIDAKLSIKFNLEECGYELSEDMNNKIKKTNAIYSTLNGLVKVFHISWFAGVGSFALAIVVPEVGVVLYLGSWAIGFSSGVAGFITPAFLPSTASISEQSKWFYEDQTPQINWNESTLQEIYNVGGSTVVLVLGKNDALPSLLNSLLLELCPLHSEVGYAFLSNESSKIYQVESSLFNKRVTVIFIPTTSGKLKIPKSLVYRVSVTFIFEYSQDEDISALLDQQVEVRVSRLAVFCRREAELRRKIEDVIFEKHIQFRVVHEKIEKNGDNREIKDHMIEYIGASACMSGSDFRSTIAEVKAS